MQLSIPEMPTWSGLHPLVVHFPIALLLVAPLFALIGLVAGEKGRCFGVSAFVLMLLGVAGAWVSVATGHAGADIAFVEGEAEKVLDQHESLAHFCRASFTALAVVYAVIIALPIILKKRMPAWLNIVLQVAFLVAYGVAMLALVNVGHLGGWLVHELDVRAMM